MLRPHNTPRSAPHSATQPSVNTKDSIEITQDATSRLAIPSAATSNRPTRFIVTISIERLTERWAPLQIPKGILNKITQDPRRQPWSSSTCKSALLWQRIAQAVEAKSWRSRRWDRSCQESYQISIAFTYGKSDDTAYYKQ